MKTPKSMTSLLRIDRIDLISVFKFISVAILLSIFSLTRIGYGIVAASIDRGPEKEDIAVLLWLV